MTQAELNRAVAKVTGETVRTVAERGVVPFECFSHAAPFVLHMR